MHSDYHRTIAGGMGVIAMIVMAVSLSLVLGSTALSQTKPGAVSPISDESAILISKAGTNAISIAPRTVLGTMDATSSSQLGGDRLEAMQYTDGSWGWPLTAPPTYGNILGPIGMGVAQAFRQTADAGMYATASDAGAYLLTKTNNFSPSDGYLAAELDRLLGVTTYTAHVKTNFYDQLAAGTYNRNGLGTLYSTAAYVSLIRTNRSGSQANLAAWDIGMGLVGAAECGESTVEWITGVKAEIDELNASGDYDVIGLAGALYGLAFVGEEYDPTAGAHAAAANLADLAVILAGYQIAGGGFAWNSAYVIPDDGNETIQETGYAILALNEVDRPTYLSAIHGAADYMMGVQLVNGGWENYPGSGENNEVTAEALWGISAAYPPPVHNVTQDVYYSTIKGALDNASSGDLIHVGPGTYTEGPQLVVNKNITIVGDGKLTTIITPSANTTNSGDSRGWFLVNAGFTFNLSHVTLDGTGKLVSMGILNKGNGTIDNVRFMNIKYNESTEYAGIGMSVRESSGMNVNVTNCEFSGMGRIGVHYRAPGVTGTISGSTFTGKGPGNWLDYGIEAGGAPLPGGGAHLIISNNTITNNKGVASDGSTSAGILVTTYFGPGTEATITGCTLTNNTDGIAVGYDGADASVVVAHNNVISGNIGYGINSTNPYVNATYNYWGTLHGPADTAGTIEVPKLPVPSVANATNMLPAPNLGNAVTENVDYYPWNGPATGHANGGIWATGYVNPTANDLFMGFDAAALDAVDPMDTVAPPPPPDDYLFLYFLLAPGQPLENYSIDIKKDEAPLAADAKGWDLKALTDHTSALVNLSFLVSGLPSGFHPTLYDLSAGTYKDLSTDPTHSYTSPASEVPSSFRILIGDSTDPAVAVVTPNGGEYLVVGSPYNITWTSSDGTGVLRHYIYYSGTGAAPYTLLDSVNGATLSYAWTPLSAAGVASIKVTARDSVMNEETDISNASFTVLTSGSVAYSAAAGWNLLSVPMLQGVMTPAAVFGDDYGATPYYTYGFSPSSGYSIPTTLNMGQGYWLGSNSPQAIDAVGTALSSASLPLVSGFNIIGNPFATDMDVADLAFTDGVDTFGIAAAATAGWLSNVLYGYNGVSYYLESSTLEYWKGYWVPMLVNGKTAVYSPSVVVPTPKSVPVVEIADPAAWGVELGAVLKTDDGAEVADRIAAFGVRSDAVAGFSPRYDAPRPPRSPAGTYVELSIAGSDDAFRSLFGDAAVYARKFMPADKAGWEIVVTSSSPGEVTLRWDNARVAALPSNVRVELCDAAGGRTIDMKTASSYTYTQAGTERRFSVNKPSGVIPAAWELSQNYPNPFNPTTTIAYGLPSAAAVSIEVFNFLGQRVAVLLSGDALQTAGYHEVLFDAGGLASGVYYYTITATAAEGNTFTNIRKMVLLK